jgi:hypothetical protein
MDKANALLDDRHKFGMTFNDSVTEDTCQGKLGLTPEQFGQYVSEAYVSVAAISAFAHEVALIRCADAGAAAEVRKLVALGFDSGQWVCVSPDQSYVMGSGEYVLLVATSDPGADAIKAAFAALAGGDSGDADVFFTA